MSLYPLVFKPIFKEKLWGGEKIRTILNKDFSPLENCGETWEISGVQENTSVVSNGPLSGKDLNSLVREYKEKLVGKSVYKKHGETFPLLIKFIDANADLSIQVHPDDELAQKRHNSSGKSELWYIFQADEGASLISGFNKEVSKEEYLDHLKKGTLTEILNKEPVKAGDAFYLPAGRVHTIGKGLLLAEIQQTSDITYRIYDFDRVDKDGNKRELHTEEALDAIDYSFYKDYKTRYLEQQNTPSRLVDCKYFSTNKITFDRPLSRDYSNKDSFIIYVCFEGKFSIKTAEGSYAFQKGDAVLLPAAIKEVELIPEGETSLLETWV